MGCGAKYSDGGVRRSELERAPRGIDRCARQVQQGMNLRTTRTLLVSLLSLLCISPNTQVGVGLLQPTYPRKPCKSWLRGDGKMIQVAGESKLTRVIDEHVQREAGLAKQAHKPAYAFDARQVKRQRLNRRTRHLSPNVFAGGGGLGNNGRASREQRV